MSRRDAETVVFEEWLQQLGYCTQLQPEEVQRLMAPNVRSMWRHLKAFIKPVRTVETIRKNLLVAKLCNENVSSDQIGNFKIQSCEELAVVKKVSRIQKELDCKSKERKVTDGDINSLKNKIIEKRYNIISKEITRKESEDKLTLMNLKLAQFQRDIEKLEEDNSKAKGIELMSCIFTEDRSNVSEIVTFLMDRKISSLESVCSEEDEQLFLSLLMKCSVKAFYQAFILASNNVYTSLKCFAMNLDIPKLEAKKTRESNVILSFSDHLRHLNALVIQNQLNIHDYTEKVRIALAALNEEKTELVDLMKGDYPIGSEQFFEAEMIVEKLVNLSLSSSKGVKLNQLMQDLETDSPEYESSRLLVAETKTKDQELQREITMKVGHINSIYSKIYKYNSKVDQVKNEVANICFETVNNFLGEMTKQKDLDCVIFNSKHVMIDEIKVVYGAPLSALTRRWENSEVLLRKELMEKLFTDPKLRVFLLQSEPKNILASVLEKKLWIHKLS